MKTLFFSTLLIAYAFVFSLVAKSLPSQNEIKQVVQEISK